MKIRLFGHISMSIDLIEVDLRGPLSQLAVAVLAANAPRAVTSETLIRQLWHDELADTDVPKNPRLQLQEIMKRLRQAIEKAGGDRTLVPDSRDGSYRIQVDPDDVDLHRFHTLRSLARKPGLPPEEAVRLFRSAFAEWEGDPGGLRPEPYAGLTAPWAERQRVSLDAHYHADLLECLRLELELDRHHEVVPQLVSLNAGDPLHERIAGMLMRAHYCSGQQNEALGVYRRVRAALKEIGRDPSPELDALHNRVLKQDPTLDFAEATTQPIHRSGGEQTVAENQFTNTANDNAHVHLQVSQVNGDLHTGAPKPTDVVRRQLKQLRRDVREARRDKRLADTTANKAVEQLDEAAEFLDRPDGRDVDSFVNALEAFQRLLDGEDDLTGSAARLMAAAKRTG
jgi:DNA-binding SARP family transcriptional activator